MNSPESGKYTAAESLVLPDSVIVTSASLIKVETVKKVLAELFPDRQFDVVGVKAKSMVNEQPVGDETELGARNRIEDAEQIVQDTDTPHVYISVENGIFKISEDKYEDKAIVVIKFPNGKIFSKISSRGVLFPIDAIKKTMEKPGGFKDHTVGSTLAEIFTKQGIEMDKQDPHKTLTDSKFTRRDQITSTLKETLRDALK
jgi:non-canonical (house-cleaning) NTP pyrophosphatase